VEKDSLLLVVQKGDASLGFYDPTNGQERHRIELDPFPHEWVISADQRYAYIAHFGLALAEDAGLGLRPEWVDETIESIKKDNKIESEEQFQAALASEGMTLDDLRKSIEKSWTKRMIIQPRRVAAADSRSSLASPSKVNCIPG